MGIQQNLQVFHTKDQQQFRTILRDGEPWFVLADVCRALEIGNPSQASSRLDDDERGIISNDTPSGVQQMVIVSESGLFSLILSSRKQEAKRFKKWVTSEVLPSIRKTGGYGARIPAFIQRYNANWDRVAVGYFSVINELTIRVLGRLEQAGYIVPDRSLDGVEIRPENSVGRLFADWVRKNHPEFAEAHSTYLHETPETTVEARQYPNFMWPLFIAFVDQIWIPHHAERYFCKRAPDALIHLPKLLPSPGRRSSTSAIAGQAASQRPASRPSA